MEDSGNKELGSLTKIEIEALQSMQSELKRVFDYATSEKREDTYREQIANGISSIGYAIITDILSRNRPNPNP